MALSSFFLVTSDHRHAEIRRAGYLYLLIAHLGAISILLCFGRCRRAPATTRSTQCVGPSSRRWATGRFPACARRLRRQGRRRAPACVAARGAPGGAFAGLGADVAVMLKTAIYGMLRVTLDLIGSPLWWWGVIALAADW